MFSLNFATLNAQHGSRHNTSPLTLHTGAVGVFAGKFTTYGNTTFTSNTAVGDGGRIDYERSDGPAVVFYSSSRRIGSVSWMDVGWIIGELYMML